MGVDICIYCYCKKIEKRGKKIQNNSIRDNFLQIFFNDPL